MPWDFNGAILPAYPPAGLPGLGGAESVAAGLTTTGSIASGTDWAAWLEFGGNGRYFGIKVDRPVIMVSGGPAPQEDTSAKEGAAIGSASTQTKGNLLTRASSWVQNKIDAVGSAAMRSEKNWNSFKAKVKRGWDAAKNSPLGRVAAAAVGIVLTFGAVAAGGGIVAVGAALAGAAFSAWAIGMAVGGIDAASGGMLGSAVEGFMGQGGMAAVDGINTAVNILGWAGGIAVGAGWLRGKMLGSGHRGIGGIAGKTSARRNPWSPEFPSNPDDFLPGLPRRYTSDGFEIEINPSTKVRYEGGHQLNNGATYNPRHHGPHYHVETKVDTAYDWSEKVDLITIKNGQVIVKSVKNSSKALPQGYINGMGTGFLRGESLPWELTTNL